MTRFSAMLEGRELPDGWRVISHVARAPGQTGGRFSDSYLVERVDGLRGFLKAMDYSSAIASSDPTTALKPLVEAYDFERDLLFECRDRDMDRVVLPLAHGTVLVDPAVPYSNVPYIIFERGDGDVRIHLLKLDWIDVAWAMRAVHQIALGLSQLHEAQVAHQDLKPSNVMVFGPSENKVGDLGHAVRRGQPLARPEHRTIGGDPAHAPPEQLYDDVPSDWLYHRVGGDLYHLGSLIVFFFSRTTMTALLRLHTPGKMQPGVWPGSYADVLPVVRDAFDRAIEAFSAEVPESVRGEVVAIVRQLCDPEPLRRGHPRSRAMKHGNPLSLERYVGQFDRISRTVSRNLKVRTA